MLELFIYYRLDPVNTQAAQRAVVAFQELLRARFPWLRTRLLRRPQPTDGQETWMETYSADPTLNTTGITPEVLAEIELQARVIAPYLQDARHIELFVACAS